MKHVAIVGGGVIGLSAALECARRGHRVTVIERAPARRGASLGNAGMIVPSHFVPLAAPGMIGLGLKWMWNPESPFYIQPRLDWDLLAWAIRFWRASTPERVQRVAPLLRDLHLASRELYARLAEEEDFGLVKKGLLMLCKTERALEEEARTAAKAQTLDIPAKVLDAPQTAARDPSVTMDIAGAVYFEKDCHLDPARYVATLERRLRATGAELLYDGNVIGWRREGDRFVAARTTRGEIAADEFILAGGAWSPELGLRLPMQAGKGYSVTLPEPIEQPQLCSIFTEARIAVTPMGNALRFGGTMEIAGTNERINPRRVEGILRAVPHYFPHFRREHFAGLQPWCGLRPCSPDGLPYLGRTRAATNLVVATGHAMMGLSLAPITGELVGQLVDREPPRFDLGLLDVDRYA
ncbi:FAD dependent oxidoreductase [Chthoniobacter flavus Ellin428]|uniref:FAD dependent oxidoreductase n=1 Tax=Chthoniobacter flavus Ellin428 TaxID=497964 RepID=B4CZA2_9BACT|nr:FAD-dependent oxidoreductase [Chthoniobacter flavus]EDY20793.1 FAD dependent oxidoreductase [Chthoniobacter flavus Ellin428]TCO89686.1 D-amino-acid dehydrogenase [Chthoniobacter flavus]